MTHSALLRALIASVFLAALAPLSVDAQEPASQDAPPVEVADTAVAEPDLVPEGEAEMMASHPVDPETGISFRPGKGLSITSADGNFQINTRVRAQFLYSLRGHTAGSPSGEDFSHDLRIRRARLAFTGFFFGEDNRYKLEIAVSPNDLAINDHAPNEDIDIQTSPLLDFYFDFRQNRDFNVRIGQYKVPYNRQRVISSGNLQMVDRSIANGEFNLDRDIGFDLRSRDLGGLDMFRYYAGIYMGRGRDSRGFEDFGDLGLTAIGRVEYLPFGMFNDYKEVDFERSADPRLSLGFAYSYQNNANGLRRIRSSSPDDCIGMPGDLTDPGSCANEATTPGTVDNHNITADMMFKMLGFSAQSEVYWRAGTRDPGQDDMGVVADFVEPARNGVGWFLQAGYLLPSLPVELSARYSITRGIGDRQAFVDVDAQDGYTSLGDENALGGGLSWYIARHPYKVQLDYFRVWGDEIAGIAGEHILRLQLQGSI